MMDFWDYEAEIKSKTVEGGIVIYDTPEQWGNLASKLRVLALEVEVGHVVEVTEQTNYSGDKIFMLHIPAITLGQLPSPWG